MERETFYHIISSSDWESFKNQDAYAPSSIEKEGFIHFSTKPQVLTTASKFYSGRTDLLLLEVKVPKIDSNFRWDWVESRKENFGHYYAPLPIGFISRVEPLRPSGEKDFLFPEVFTL